jgi:uncharacterized protein
MTRAADGGRWLAIRRTAVVLAGGAVGGVALTLAQVPAGTLIGAVLCSALTASRLNGNGRTEPGADGKAVAGPDEDIPADADRQLNMRPFRVAGLVLLGCLSGVGLNGHTFQALGRIALPLVGAVLALLALNVGLAAFLSRRYGVDPLTALLACAPGGVSELAGAAQDMGARLGVVLAIHVVRVLAVVLIVLPVAIVVLRRLG